MHRQWEPSRRERGRVPDAEPALLAGSVSALVRALAQRGRQAAARRALVSQSQESIQLETQLLLQVQPLRSRTWDISPSCQQILAELRSGVGMPRKSQVLTLPVPSQVKRDQERKPFPRTNSSDSNNPGGWRPAFHPRLRPGFIFRWTRIPWTPW